MSKFAYDPVQAFDPEPVTEPLSIGDDRAAGADTDAADTETLSQRDKLLLVADAAEVWRDPNGETYATIAAGGHREHYALHSTAFRDWLLTELARRFTVKGRPASATAGAFSDALLAIEARARVTGIVHEAPLRVARHGEAIYIDLGDPTWRAVEVTAAGWRVIDAPPVPILRSRKTAALPVPRGSGRGPDGLRALLPGLSDDGFVLLVAWMLAALYPAGPFPVLVLAGEQGAGKSTIARIARRLTDPTTGDLLAPPREDRDLIAAARHNRVLAFDNLSGLKPELADSLCRLSTGGELGGRQLFSDHDLATFTAMRPVVINGIADLATRGDLASRALALAVQRPPQPAPESDLRRRIEAVAPEVFAALLDGLACVLKRRHEVAAPNLRMADFGQLAIAAEDAFGWPEGTVARVLQENAATAAATLSEGDPVARAVQELAMEVGEWRGLVSGLHDLLTGRIAEDTRRSKEWPANARWFSDRLRRAAGPLRQIGIAIHLRDTNRGREVTVIDQKEKSSAISTTPQSGGSGASGAGDANRPLSIDEAALWELDL